MLRTDGSKVRTRFPHHPTPPPPHHARSVLARTSKGWKFGKSEFQMTKQVNSDPSLVCRETGRNIQWQQFKPTPFSCRTGKRHDNVHRIVLQVRSPIRPFDLTSGKTAENRRNDVTFQKKCRGGWRNLGQSSDSTEVLRYETTWGESEIKEHAFCAKNVETRNHKN
jgi:hypothetical protein